MSEHCNDWPKAPCPPLYLFPCVYLYVEHCCVSCYVNSSDTATIHDGNRFKTVPSLVINVYADAQFKGLSWDHMWCTNIVKGWRACCNYSVIILPWELYSFYSFFFNICIWIPILFQLWCCIFGLALYCIHPDILNHCFLSHRGNKSLHLSVILLQYFLPESMVHCKLPREPF